MKAAKVKTFYNTHFFKEGQPIDAHLILTFEIGEAVVRIPGVKVKPGDTIASIFKAYHQFLLENGDQAAEEQETPLDKVLDISIVNYRSHAYFLDVLEGDRYIVRRKEDGGVLDPASPTARGVVKRYKGGNEKGWKRPSIS